jgi:hypothetical protein
MAMTTWFFHSGDNGQVDDCIFSTSAWVAALYEP